MDRVPCDICGKSYRNDKSLATHKYSYHRNHKAKTIDSPTEDKETLALHIYPTQEDKPMDSSGKDYLDQYLEARNYRYDHEDFKKYKKKMKTRAEKKKDKPYDEPSTSGNVQSNQCRICKLQLPSQEALEDHVEAKHPKCDVCGYRFHDHDAANRHYETYHGSSKQPIICLICQKRFWKEIDLNHHQAEHPQCPECNKRFLTRSELSKHRLEHNTRRDKRCAFCDKSFRTDAEILRHQKRNHPKCDYCSQSFLTKTELEKHKQIHSLDSQKGQINPRVDPFVAEKLAIKDRDDTIDNDKRMVPRSTREYYSEPLKLEPGSDDSQSTIENDNRIIPRDPFVAEKLDSDDSQATIDNDNRIVPRDPFVAEKLANDTRTPRNQDVTIEDYYSDRSVESIDESVTIESKIEPGSDDTIDNENRLVIRDEEMPLDDRFDREPSINSQSTIDIASLPDVDMPSSSDESRKRRADSNDSQRKRRVLPRLASSSPSEDDHDEPVKCPTCHKMFARKSILDKHIKTLHNRKKCVFCDEYTSNRIRHIRSEHNFSCKLCKKRFKFETELTEHISIEHPTCDKCNKTFLSKRELLVHQKDHPEDKFIPEESSDDSSDDEELSEGEAGDKREARDFKEHINCVTVKKFSMIRDLINKNDFKTLIKDKELLESLGLIMYGVKRGFIPICSEQRLVLTNSQKELLYRIARNPSGRLVMKYRHDLSLLFDVLWKSVKYVSDVFQEYNK